MRRVLLGLVLAMACGCADAAPFVIRTAGADTAIAIDMSSIRGVTHYRTGWTYEFFRERNWLFGSRTQIIGVLELVNCKTRFVRRLKVVHYLKDGTLLSREGKAPAWTDTLRGSNTDLMTRAMCEGVSPAWARRQAGDVFDLYGKAWR